MARYLMILLAIIPLNFQNCSRQYRNDGFQQQSSTYQGEHLPKQILVRMKSLTTNETMKTWALSNGLTLEKEWSDMNLTHWSWVGDMDVAQVDALLQQQPFATDVEYAEPNYIFSAPDSSVLAATTPTTLATTTTTNGQTAAAVGLVEVRSKLTPGKAPIVVAIIDSGVDLQHELFGKTGALWTNALEIPGNGIDDDNNGYIDDVNGWNFVSNNNNPDDDNQHGTHCAGIVLGTGQDIFATSPSPSKVKIMPLKFLDATGGGPTSAAVNAIFYAVRNGARVLSNSWGGASASRALEDAMNYAYQNNAVFIAAAGNASANNDISPTYPATYLLPNVVSVAATTDTDALASFSNFGPSSVVMAAPGVRILSSVPNNLYSYLSGTSMATPFVAGTAALMLYEKPEMNGYELKELLLKKSDMINLSGKVVMNHRLNVVNSVVAAKTATITGYKPPYILETASLASEQKQGGGCGLVLGQSGSGPTNPFWTILFLAMPVVILINRRLQHPAKA